MEHVAHLQSPEHMENLYKYKGNSSSSKNSNRSGVKKERAPSGDEAEENGEGNGEAAERKPRKRKSDDESDDSRGKRRKKSKSRKKDKKKRRSKKKKKRRYYSSSDSYSDTDSEDAADAEAKHDAAKRAMRLSKKFAGGKKSAGLAAEVRIAVAQAEARARDLARKEDEELARNTNVFGKAQDRIKSEATKEFGTGNTAGFVKKENEMLTYTEHKKQRGDDDDDDFIKKLKADKDLMDSDEEGFDGDVHDEKEYEKEEIEIIPEKIEAKPRTKLSFIAPRIPVNRKMGFGTNALQAQQGVAGQALVKSAGGIAIKSMAAGGAAITTTAAFAGAQTFQDVNAQQQALELSQQIAGSMYGAHEIHATMQARAREHELQALTNIKSEEAKLAKNAVKMNILDSFKQMRLPIPDFAALGLEPIPCGMAMPGYAYDVGTDGNEAGYEVDGHDCFDMLDIKVY